MTHDYYDYQTTYELKKPLVLISFVNDVTRAVANSLASTTGLPLRSIDDLVEHRLAASAIEFLAEGELREWREREKQELERTLVSRPLAVVALGEGALSNPESLALVLAESDYVYLYVSISEAQRLAAKQGANRKATLLAELRTDSSDLETGLTDLYERRRGVYEQAHHSLDILTRPMVVYTLTTMKDTPKGTGAGRQIAEECLAVRIRMLNRILTGIYDDAFRPFGMTTSQANMLTAIQQAGPIGQSDLANVLHLEKSTLSRNVAILRKRGWVRVLPGDDDRSHALAITAKGTKLLEEALPAWQEAQKRAVEVLGDAGASAVKSVADQYLRTP